MFNKAMSAELGRLSLVIFIVVACYGYSAISVYQQAVVYIDFGCCHACHALVLCTILVPNDPSMGRMCQ